MGWKSCSNKSAVVQIFQKNRLKMTAVGTFQIQPSCGLGDISHLSDDEPSTMNAFSKTKSLHCSAANDNSCLETVQKFQNIILNSEV